MAAYGPAMEIVGRYEQVLDKTGTPVDLTRYLPLARRIVQEIAAIRIDGLPLETFDVRSMFALSWARQYGRQAAPGSELRWERLTSSPRRVRHEWARREGREGIPPCVRVRR